MRLKTQSNFNHTEHSQKLNNLNQNLFSGFQTTVVLNAHYIRVTVLLGSLKPSKA
uniref:Uncharacterized protein n=1 Tax=uncultured marine virus TaxID=186617 RepID=A0A0F7L1U4_9VIRU|nr:hypothetical protein [uncultured marine virus]